MRVAVDKEALQCIENCTWLDQDTRLWLLGAKPVVREQRVKDALIDMCQARKIDRAETVPQRHH